MIITKRFVYLHQPKTGGTFVTETLQRAIGAGPVPTLWEKVLMRAGIPPRFHEYYKHGGQADIPKPYRRLPVAGSVRNPFDRYVSQYKFRFWQRFPDRFPKLEAHPSFPDLTFEEFVRLAMDHWLVRVDPKLQGSSLGWHTAQFVWFYSRDARRLFTESLTREITAEEIRPTLAPSTYLRTHRLNEDLHELLREHGFPEERISFILESPRILPRGGGRREGDSWRDLYSPELMSWVEEREAPLFELFPEFRIDTPVV